MPTRLIPETLARDLTETLARLRAARAVGDEHETYVCENRLDWLLSRVPRRSEET